MGAEEALQRFRAFDFDANDDWLRYKRNLEIPADRDEATVLQRYKAKFYQREIDPDFDPALLKPAAPTSSSKPAASQPPTGASSEPGRPAPTASASTATASTSGTTATASAKGAAAKTLNSWRAALGRWLHAGPQGVLFGLHVMLLVLGVLYVQPLQPRLSYAAWRMFLQVAIAGYAYKVYLKAGTPPLRPFPAAPKAWLARVGSSTDMQYMLMLTMFLTSRPYTLVLVPTLVLALYHACAFASSRFGQHPLWKKYGARLHAWLTANQTLALTYNAAAEVGVGFLIIVALFSAQRNFILVFLYWNFLRMRYFSPDSAHYQHQVWFTINSRIGPLLDRVPALRVPLGYVQRWFLSAGQAPPAR